MFTVAASAGAETPMAVSAAALSRHLLKRAPVAYPAGARAAHVDGAVALLITVSPQGKVSKAQVLNGPAQLRAAARKSVEQWVYRPFRKGQKPVAAAGLVRVRFRSGAKPKPAAKFLARVRKKYVSEPGLAAVGFSCRVEPAWREFPELEHVPPGSPFLKRLQRTRITLTTKMGGTPMTEVKPPKRPKLSPVELTHADQLVKMTRQMLNGFYRTWLPFGILGPGAPADASLSRKGSETVIVFHRRGVTDWMSFDGKLRMLHYTELIPSGEAIEETPQFAAGPNGRLLYTGTDFVVHRGEKNTHGAYRIQYRMVHGYRLPRTVEVKAGNRFDVHFRFRHCRVGR